MTEKADEKTGRQWTDYLRLKITERYLPKVTYCNCCGAEKIDGVGECYTDCMWYDGPLPRDANPH